VDGSRGGGGSFRGNGGFALLESVWEVRRGEGLGSGRVKESVGGERRKVSMYV
jgi:hypothetical protein